MGNSIILTILLILIFLKLLKNKSDKLMRIMTKFVKLNFSSRQIEDIFYIGKI